MKVKILQWSIIVLVSFVMTDVMHYWAWSQIMIMASLRGEPLPMLMKVGPWLVCGVAFVITFALTKKGVSQLFEADVDHSQKALK